MGDRPTAVRLSGVPTHEKRLGTVGTSSRRSPAVSPVSPPVKWRWGQCKATPLLAYPHCPHCPHAKTTKDNRNMGNLFDLIANIAPPPAVTTTAAPLIEVPRVPAAN